MNVHYLPVYLHSYYRERFGTRPGLCPQAEAAYEEILSLPIFPGMSDEDTNDVIEALWKVVNDYGINNYRRCWYALTPMARAASVMCCVVWP